MARVAEGWRIRQRTEDGPYYVRFRHEGQRHEITTNRRDPREAAEEAARVYADVIAGRLTPEVANAAPQPADEIFAEWLESLTTTHAASTQGLWELYVGTHFLEVFKTTADFTEQTVGRYMRARLGVALRETVKKELSALRNFVRWARVEGHLAAPLEIPSIPKSALGKRTGTRKARATELAPEAADALLAVLPEWSSAKGGGRGDRFPVRAYFTVLWETGLRPSTLQRLEVPTHYRRGEHELRITEAIDKARFERDVPISDTARAALDSVLPEKGLIFGEHDWRGFMNVAGAAARLPPHVADALSPYDLRHARATVWAETGNLPGTAFLVGHKKVTTTDRYARPTARAARAVLRAGADSGESVGEPPSRTADPAPVRAESAVFSGVRGTRLELVRCYPLAPQAPENADIGQIDGVGQGQETAENAAHPDLSGAPPPNDEGNILPGLAKAAATTIVLADSLDAYAYALAEACGEEWR